jgi:hypothetical protein
MRRFDYSQLEESGEVGLDLAWNIADAPLCLRGMEDLPNWHVLQDPPDEPQSADSPKQQPGQFSLIHGPQQSCIR